MQIMFNIGSETQTFLERLMKRLVHRPTFNLFSGVRFMFIVKADHPDVGYTITLPTVVDSEGHPTDAPVTIDISSDNGAVVSVTPNLDPDGNSASEGTVHFGDPGIANINCTVMSDGRLLGSFGAQFTVTAGDPAAISGGSITFADLTEAANPPTDTPSDNGGDSADTVTTEPEGSDNPTGDVEIVSSDESSAAGDDLEF